MLEVLFSVVTGLLVAAGFGSSVGSTLLVAPLLFTTLEPEDAFSFTRRLWPTYFLILGVVGFIGAVLSLVLPLGWQPPVALGLVTGVMATNYALTRWMRRLRPSYDDPGDDAYQRLHGLTFYLNLLVILLFGWALVRFFLEFQPLH